MDTPRPASDGTPARGVLPALTILERSTVDKLLTLDDCIVAVEAAFRSHAEGQSLPPALMHVDAIDGEFHVKAGGLTFGEGADSRAYFALKANGGFFQNQARHGLPNIVGLIYLASATTGVPLAVLDSATITILRTGAATAVAAKYLARPDAQVATICGTGRQGRIQLRSLARVLPRLERVHAWSPDMEHSRAFASAMTEELGLPISVVDATAGDAALARAVEASDAIVTCTPAHGAFLKSAWVQPGTFVAAVGADSPEKQELEPALLARAAVVTDLTSQCVAVGELHHAIAAGLMRAEDVRAELGAVIAGTSAGRQSPNEIIVFDSTGTALQDVAAAALVYEKAVAAGLGLRVALAS